MSSSPEDTAALFLRDLERFVRDAPGGPLLVPGDRVLVALSGGPDSTALAFALTALSARLDEPLLLVLAHLHHGLRGAEADADRDFASEVARRLGTPFEERRLDVLGIRSREGGSVEETARRERYRFFAEVAAARGMTKVATGHQHDDQVETVLHRIVRGAGVRGLGGIPLRRPLAGEGSPELVRPFLPFPRARIVAYLEAIGVSARTDGSNASARFFRNRLRLEVLPALRSAAPGVDEALLRLSEAARAASAVLESAARERLEALGIGRELPLRIPLAVVRGAPPGLRPILLMRAAARATGHELLSRHAAALVRLSVSATSGESVTLPGGVVARTEYGDLVMERAEPAMPPPRELDVEVPGRAESPALGCSVETRLLSGDAGAVPDATPDASASRAAVARFDRARLLGPLVLRRPRPGDLLHPRGMSGRKKLQDLFVDAKVPRPERARALVLAAGKEVAWVVGLRLDRRFAATGETREVVEVRVERMTGA